MHSMKINGGKSHTFLYTEMTQVNAHCMQLEVGSKRRKFC